MSGKDRSFSELYNVFLAHQQAKGQDDFTAACLTWLQFEHSRNQAIRLTILYILYKHYAQQPLDRNPFLTFFIELLDSAESPLEQHFVYCILEESLFKLDHTAPQDVSLESLPAVERKQSLVELLKLKVARLIEDPNIVIWNEDIPILLNAACNRILTLKENEIVRMEKLSNYPVTEYITPNQINGLIHYNQFIAMDIVPLLLKSSLSNLYLQALLNTRVTTNSIEVVHHVLVNHLTLSQEFLHYFISNSIRSCDQLDEGLVKDRQVKQVARFIQSLLERHIIPMRDYFIEIQSFCISYMKLKGVANLFRLASQEAQQHQINF